MNRFLFVLAVFFLAFLNSHSVFAFDCGNGRAGIGDSKYEIRQKCGEPAYKDQTQVGRFRQIEEPFEQDFVHIEYWLYNFGPTQLVKVVIFEEGKVIGTHEYGYGKSSTKPDFDKIVEIGFPTVMVLFHYGPPTDKEERIDTSVISLKSGGTLTKKVFVEEWTYNLGPSYFLRVYRFESGILKRIEQDNRGF